MTTVPPSPDDDASPPGGVAPLAWCLRVTVLLQCIGLAGRYLFSSLEVESDVYGLLYFDRDWSEPTALAIDNAGTGLCLLAGLLVLLPSRRSVATWIARVASLGVCAWFLALSVAHWARGGPYTEWSLLEHAVRYAGPFALAILVGVPGRVRITIADVLLRVAVSATFSAHGYKAIDHYGHFVDLILLTDANWFGIGLVQGTAEVALTWIGWIDVAVAVGVLFAPRYGPAPYAAFWGLVTATSRITALGLASWPEMLVRAGNYGVPLALLYLPSRATGTGATDTRAPETTGRRDLSTGAGE